MASIASYADTAWNAAGTSFTTSSSITWSAGDLVLAICGIEDAGATINTPTFSGGTFSPVDSNTAASTANAKSFQCTPASGGSGTVNFTTSVSKQGGISVWVITSTSGLGDHKEQHTTSKTVASTRQGTGPSVYVWCCNDFSGDGVGSATPAPTNQRRAVAANSDFDIADLVNVTTNQSYGEGATGGSAGPFTILVMEAQDAGAASPVAQARPLMPRLHQMSRLGRPWLPFPKPVTVSGPLVVPQDITATVTTTAAFTNQVGKIVSATATSTATIVKQVLKAITANATVSSSFSAIKVILLTMTATVTSTASIVRSVGKILSATATTTASIVKRVNKTLQATATSTATMSAIKVILVNITATVTSTATMARQVGLHLTVTLPAATASIVKQVGKKVTATATSTATLAATRAFLKTITATVASTATISRQVRPIISATVTTTASMTRQITARLTATVSSTASLLASFVIPIVGPFAAAVRSSSIGSFAVSVADSVKSVLGVSDATASSASSSDSGASASAQDADGTKIKVEDILP